METPKQSKECKVSAVKSPFLCKIVGKHLRYPEKNLSPRQKLGKLPPKKTAPPRSIVANKKLTKSHITISVFCKSCAERHYTHLLTTSRSHTKCKNIGLVFAREKAIEGMPISFTIIWPWKQVQLSVSSEQKINADLSLFLRFFVTKCSFDAGCRQGASLTLCLSGTCRSSMITTKRGCKPIKNGGSLPPLNQQSPYQFRDHCKFHYFHFFNSYKGETLVSSVFFLFRHPHKWNTNLFIGAGKWK